MKNQCERCNKEDCRDIFSEICDFKEKIKTKIKTKSVPSVSQLITSNTTEIQKYYDLKYNDRMIARKLNVYVGHITRWRLVNKLPANRTYSGQFGCASKRNDSNFKYDLENVSKNYMNKV